MPTSEDRREIASSLRSCDIVNVGPGRYPYSLNGSICGCMLVGSSEMRVRHATRFLASLIEPAPERTYHMEPIMGDQGRYVTVHAGDFERRYGYARCSECGSYVAVSPSLRYCPCCGAKVVSE